MKKLIIIAVIIIILFLCFTLLFGKSNSSVISDILEENNYILDNDIYRKNITNNTQEDFYRNIRDNTATKYVEFQYIPSTNILKCINLKYDKFYYLCDITEDFNNNKINYSCDSSYGNSQLTVYGEYNHSNKSLSCQSRNDKINTDVVKIYCGNVKEQINEFIIESNKLLNNRKFSKAVRGE